MSLSDKMFGPVTRRGFLGRAALMAGALTAASLAKVPGFKALMPPAFAAGCNFQCGPCEPCFSSGPISMLSPNNGCQCGGGGCSCEPDCDCGFFAACMFCCDGCVPPSGQVLCLEC